MFIDMTYKNITRMHLHARIQSHFGSFFFEEKRHTRFNTNIVDFHRFVNCFANVFHWFVTLIFFASAQINMLLNTVTNDKRKTERRKKEIKIQNEWHGVAKCSARSIIKKTQKKFVILFFLLRLVNFVRYSVCAWPHSIWNSMAIGIDKNDRYEMSKC